MPRPRNIEAREETAEAIKAIARQQLADNGTNGISLRGIARELGMTAPAIYNYFPKLDDLITALLVDAFTSHADAVDSAIAEHDNPVDALKAGLHAYRNWALAHSSDFDLIYGNPIPGYEAPGEITVPLAARPQESFTRCIMEARAAGQLTIPPDYQQVPESIEAHVSTWLYQRLPEIREIPDHMQSLYMMIVGFSRVHGITMLEIHRHIDSTIGDVDTFFSREVENYLQHIGLKE